MTVHLLGRHVANSAAACLAEALRVGELGDAEVADLAGPVAVHEDVVGFDVEVQDLVLMREFDGIADGEDDCRGDVEIEGRGRRVVDDLREGRPLDGLHDEEGLVVDGVEVVNAHDGRTAEHCTRARLGKTGDAPIGPLAGNGHALDCDTTLYARVPADLYFAAATFAFDFYGAISVQDQWALHLASPRFLLILTDALAHYR